MPVNRARAIVISALSAAAALAALPVSPVCGQMTGSTMTEAPPAPLTPPTRNVAKWNVKPGKPAIQGYDPVAYFPASEGGAGKPVKGDAKFAYTHQGVLYHFASAANLEAFKANPAKFEPAYGGWCAWAVHEGDTAGIDPKTYSIEDGRLFLFFNEFIGGNTLKSWEKKPAGARVTKADGEWLKMTGERPPEAMMSPMTSQGAGPAANPEGAMMTVLQVGERAPEFTLPDAMGKMRSLEELLKDGPVVMTWYRGAWCPYCNNTLRAYQGRIGEFKAMGATVVAISPQTPERAAEHAAKESPALTVLSDTGSVTAVKYGVAYTLDDGLREKFKGYQIDLTAYNGPGEPMLPLTATYIIKRDGTIGWRHASTNYSKRAEPGEVLEALRTMQ